MQRMAYVCTYISTACRPLLNSDKLPSRVLNGLETEPVPAELSGLDPLSTKELSHVGGQN